jgi:hypothetical protein
LGSAKEEVAPVKFSFVNEEEGENKDGSSQG